MVALSSICQDLPLTPQVSTLPIPPFRTLDLPGVPPTLWPLLRLASGSRRVALVGGAVRDWLLHQRHRDPWRGLVDLDLVIEDPALLGTPVAASSAERFSPAWELVERLPRIADGVEVRVARQHGQYGTVEVELELRSPASPPGPSPTVTRLILDVASARDESYPAPAANPVVRFGALEDDLARRDLTINAMAIDLVRGTLLDPHGGLADLAARQLRFIHPTSLRDDPTRLVRAARYAARLGFDLAEDGEAQARATLASWPWAWRTGDAPEAAPAALGTRLRRELELVLERENWRIAFDRLQSWGGLLLLDPLLQEDVRWPLRLYWASRFDLPMMAALIAGAGNPLALAERLQVPHRQYLLLCQYDALQRRLQESASVMGSHSFNTVWEWCQLLEAPGLSPEAVALALVCGVGPRRPLLRWWLRWRHLGPERSAEELMAAGVPKGPELGVQLRLSRQHRLEREKL